MKPKVYELGFAKSERAKMLAVMSILMDAGADFAVLDDTGGSGCHLIVIEEGVPIPPAVAQYNEVIVRDNAGYHYI